MTKEELETIVIDLQNEIRNLKSLLDKSIIDYNNRINILNSQVNKNQFSNLYVFDEEVKFRNMIIFPKLETPIETSTNDSTGRIVIKDDTGTLRYIPYF